jgi:hypothetical protein
MALTGLSKYAIRRKVHGFYYSNEISTIYKNLIAVPNTATYNKTFRLANFENCKN